MASLNTLRTKFGYVLSAIIAFALLAFIFSLKSEMGFSSNDVKVGEINSEDVLYSEYYAEYEEVKRQSGATESTEEQAAAIANAAWQAVISKKLLLPGFEDLGLSMSEEERIAVINGEVSTQTFGSAFIDPATGIYNAGYVAEFLSQASSNPQVEAVWAELNTRARNERMAIKFSALVRSGSYANKLEVAQGVATANSSYSGKWVNIPYSSQPDSLFTVSNAEIKKYYDEHKETYKKTPSRSLSYVTFAFEPTEQDIIDLENNALSTSKEFAVAENLNDYVRANLNGSISSNYISATSLPEAQAAAFAADQMYGPINAGNAWTMSRVASKIAAPDSVGLRHIVLNYTQEALADSLVTALKAGADFAQAAMENSQYAQTAQIGGEVGVMPFSAFSDEFIAPLASAKKGDIVKIMAGDMIQVLEVYRVDNNTTHYKVATVEYPVEPSQATITTLHGNAGLYSIAATGSADKFKSAADEYGVIVRTASISNGERTIRSVTDSREIARWAFGAEAGQISDIFKTSEGYVVAMLTAVDNDEYRSMDALTPSIKTMILRDKKFEKSASQISGSSIEAIAEALNTEVKEFNDVTFAAQYVPGIGVEPKVVGAITLSNKVGLTAPIQGNSATYVLDIEPAIAAEEPQTEAMERARAQATVEDRMSQYVFNAVQGMANIQDLRGKYF